jgi:DNA-binding XRE family transcriptional regulator
MKNRQELINKLHTIIAIEHPDHLKAIKCANIAEEYADMLFNDTEYVKSKIKAINDNRKKILLQSLNRKKSEKDLLLKWQQGLNAKRKASSLSLSDVASELSVTKQSIHKWENCISKIPVKKALSLADLLNYPISI